MKPAPFAIVRPLTLAQALAVLREYGEEARILAGGQTLVPMLAMRFAAPKVLIDINGIEELKRMDVDDAALYVGAGVTQARLQQDRTAAQAQPLIRMALPWVAHPPIRNRGTVVGSLCHADPSAELPLVLATLGGSVTLRSARKQRRVAAKDFFLGALQIDRAPDEMAVSAEFPVAPRDARFDFAEFGYRRGDFAVVAVAGFRQQDQWRIGFGGIDDYPRVMSMVSHEAGDVHAAVEEWASVLDVRDDATATSTYRRHLMRGLGRRVVGALARAA